MKSANDVVAFYEDNYRTLGSWALQPGKRIFLGNKDIRRCRFCGRGEPEVSFRKEAHAIPECVGNKSLFTYHECDSCNSAFGEGCENDFGNWSLPMRTMARICGKTGVPSIKHDSEGKLRIDSHPAGLEISVDAAEGFLDNDPATNTLTFHLRRGPYRPGMVVQAMIKMALAVMPEEEMLNFQQALTLIKPQVPALLMSAPTPFFHTFVPGGSAMNRMVFAVMTRKRDESLTPYAYVFLRYGNEMLQLAVPCPERDGALHGKQITLAPHPCTTERDRLATRTELLQFVSMDFVRNEEISVTASYGDRRPR